LKFKKENWLTNLFLHLETLKKTQFGLPNNLGHSKDERHEIFKKECVQKLEPIKIFRSFHNLLPKKHAYTKKYVFFEAYKSVFLG